MGTYFRGEWEWENRDVVEGKPTWTLNHDTTWTPRNCVIKQPTTTWTLFLPTNSTKFSPDASETFFSSIMYSTKAPKALFCDMPWTNFRTTPAVFPTLVWLDYCCYLSPNRTLTNTWKCSITWNKLCFIFSIRQHGKSTAWLKTSLNL